MDIKTKTLVLIMGLLFFISFSLTAYRYLIKKDYIIQAETDCDPYTETCFIWECDINSSEEGEKCVGDSEADIWYYKIIKRNASKIPLCDSTDENCRALVCEENESDCEFTLCTDENKEENGVSECSDPIAYAIENPIAEECEEEDIDCLSAEEKMILGEGEEDSMVQTTDDMISGQEEGEEELEEGGLLPVVEEESIEE
jgi:hypothetical protein